MGYCLLCSPYSRSQISSSTRFWKRRPLVASPSVTASSSAHTNTVLRVRYGATVYVAVLQGEAQNTALRYPCCTAHPRRSAKNPVKKKLRPSVAFVLLAAGLVAWLVWFPPDPEYAGWRSDPPNQPAHEWPTADGFTGNHRSELRDITPDNVRHLEVAWIHQTGDVSQGGDGEASTAFQSTPVMVDGSLHDVTPFSRALALDPETGEELWSFDPHMDRPDSIQGKVTTRGHSVWTD